MVSTAPVPVDVVDFQFKAHCRLKIFEKDPTDDFANTCSLVSVASRFGLIFVGTKSNELQVIQVNHIEDLSKDVGNYKRRTVLLPSRPSHVSINCDSTKLAVVIEKDGCPFVIIYDALSFLKQNVQVLKEIRLSATPGCKILSTDWNPALPEIFTACKNDGSLGVYEFKGNSYEFHELPSAAGATCFCWSPKGKQIAVGSRDGKITQYKPDLKAVKAVDAPAGFTTIMTLCWLSSFQFVGIYVDTSDQNSLICVDAPKTGPSVYTNYEDVCYSNGNARPQQFYLIHQQHWNVVMVASSNSMEVGVLGLDGNKWIQWTLSDNSRAELPLSAKKQDTLPIGVTFNVGATKYQVGDEVKHAPMLMVLSNYGVLCTFHVINSRPNALDICCPLEAVSDRSGDGSFTMGTTPLGQQPQQISIGKQTNLPLQPKPVMPVGQMPNANLPLAPQQHPSALHQGFVPASTAPITKSYGFTQAKPQATQSNQLIGNSFSPAGFGLQSASQPSVFKPQLQPSQQQPLINRNVGLGINPPTSSVQVPKPPIQHQLPQPSLLKPQPVEPTKSESSVILKTPESKLSTSTITNSNVTSTGKLPINEETDAMIAQLIREECQTLEAELKNILQRGGNVHVKVGTDVDAMQMDKRAVELENFYKEIKENINTLDSEVYTLNQSLMQTWACYEEGRTRFLTSKDPVTRVLLQSMPLDPASQYQFDEITRMMYYLESQLVQANHSLDEQWDTFQDTLMKRNKLKLPTMESVYQTMVQHSKTLQKQKYMLKHISNKIKSTKRCSTLINMSTVEKTKYVDLEHELSKLQIHPNSAMPQQYNKLIERQSKLDKCKSKKLYDLISKHEASLIFVPKPELNNSTIQLTTLLAAPLSPIGVSKKGLPVKLDFVMSTPKPQEIKIIKGPVQTFTPTSLHNQLASQLNSFGTASGIIGKPLPISTSGLTPGTYITPIPGTGNTGSMAKPVTSAFGFGAVSSNSGFNSGSSPSQTWSQSSVTASVPSSQFDSSILIKSSKNSFGSVGMGATTSAKSMFGFTTTSSLAYARNEPAPVSLSTSNVLKVTTPTTTAIAGHFKTETPANSASPIIATTTVSTFAKFAPPSTASPAPKSVFGSSHTAASTVSMFGSSALTTTATTTKEPMKNLFGIPSSAKPVGFGFVASSAGAAIGSTTVTPVTTVKPALLATPPSTVAICALPAATQSISSPSIFGSISSTSNTSTSEGGFFDSKTNTPQGSIFGGVTKSSSGTSLFGTVSSSTPSTSLSSITATNPAESVNIAPASSTSSIFATSKPFGSSGSLFGSSAAPAIGTTGSTTSIFAAAAAAATNPPTSKHIFGAPPTTLTSGAFGGTTPTTTTSNSAFGTSAATTTETKSVFAVPAASTGIFGAQAATSVSDLKPATSSIFGGAGTIASSASPAFAAGTPTTSTTVFEGAVAATATTTTSIFASAAATNPVLSSDKPATAIPAFGSSANVFGSVTSPSSTTQAFGSTTSGFASNTTTTSPSVFGTAATTIATTAFASNGQSPFNANPLFGSSTFGSIPTAAPTTSPFGQPAAAVAAVSPFGQAAPTTSVVSAFGQTAPATSNVSPFGQTAPTTSVVSPFGQTAPTTAVVSPFGQTAATTSTPFGGSNTSGFSSGSLFSQPAKFGSGSVFGGGTTTTSSGFGAPSTVFGQASNASPATSPFGSTGAFGSTNSFGPATPTTTSTGFAQSPLTQNTFGNSFSGSAFGAQPSAQPFGSPASTPGNTFSNFGGLSVGAATPSNTFGQATASPNPFGRTAEQKPQFGGTSSNLFGTPASTATTSNVFGSQPAQSSFGNTSFGNTSFGGTNQPGAFGNTSFGSNPQGAFSSNTQSVQQSGFGGSPSFQKPAFGSTPVFGQPAFGGSASFGTSPSFGGGATFGSPQKVFGVGDETSNTFGGGAVSQTSTFGSIANQTTVGFGNLAQQATQSQPLSFSGNSSFTNWRN